MNVQVEAFARAREVLGAGAFPMDLPDGADVRELFRLLVLRAPDLARLEERLMVAVNERYATWEEGLSEGDRVALIPPVSGG